MGDGRSIGHRPDGERGSCRGGLVIVDPIRRAVVADRVLEGCGAAVVGTRRELDMSVDDLDGSPDRLKDRDDLERLPGLVRRADAVVGEEVGELGS